MTRPEATGKRDLTFSQWIRKKLPSSYIGFMVTDVDFFIYNFITKKLLILEVKTRNKKINKWQRIFYEHLNRWIKKGIDADWAYKGAYLIKFENTSFDDGRVWFTSFEQDITIEVTEKAVIKFLSLE